MKRVRFYFDVVSPFSYLAFEQLPQALEGCHYVVDYHPVLLAGVLRHWGQKGPAEIEPKRAWTYRHVSWLAHERGIMLQMPAHHPFNPLALQRLALACGPAQSLPGRHVVAALMRHVWRSEGADAEDPQRLDALLQDLTPLRDITDPEVKQELHTQTDQALGRNVFGVPSFEVAGRLFWGLDALPMLRAALQGGPWFDGPAWDEAGHVAGPAA